MSTTSERRPGAIVGSMIGGLLVAYGIRRGGAFGHMVGVAGAGVLATTLAPRLARLRHAPGTSDRAIEIDSTFVIGRPRAVMFHFFRNFENLPLLGGLLHSVDDFDDGSSRWRLMAPGGRLVEWDVIISKYVPPRVIGWESVPRAAVESRGTIRLDAVEERTTRVTLTARYRPCTPEARLAVRAVVARRPDRRLRAIVARIEAAMQRAQEPGLHDHAPRYPLPDPGTGPQSWQAPQAPQAAPVDGSDRQIV